jgi:hypothetical protein
MRMISKEGTEVFTITRPGGIVLKASGLINEK